MSSNMRAAPTQRYLYALGAIVLSVAVLYWARQVIIPLALAALIALLLSPLVNWLQRHRVPRLPAVLLVVCAMLALGFGMFRVVFGELGELARNLPEHTQTITRKIDSLRSDQGYIWNQLGQFIHDINQELSAGGDANSSQPLQVIVQKEALSAFSLFPMVALPLLEMLLTVAFIFVLVVFILMRKEDLRDRLLQTAGRGQSALTTTTLDEAGDRIGKLMLRQLGVNIGFGVLFWIGLAVIGIPYAFLWGFLGGLLRFVPYVGTAFALVFPLTLSFAVFEGWAHSLSVVALFLCLELIIANVVEPLLFSHSAGASPIALLVAAAFWTWLWGPIGLVLSAPLTVCLAVLGRNIPQFKFFDILLSPRPVLSSWARFYHRVLAHDRDAATMLLEEALAKRSVEMVSDELLIPALVMVRQDVARGDLTAADGQELFQEMRDLFEETVPSPPAGEDGAPPNGQAKHRRILICPARGADDTLAAEYLHYTVDAVGWPVEIVSLDKLATTAAEAGKGEQAPVVCLVAVAPGGVSELRAHCKRLRARAPEVKILAGSWGQEDNHKQVHDYLTAAGADAVAFTLLDTRNRARAWVDPTTEAVPCHRASGGKVQETPCELARS
jgi:predicted PurR-regulated permease PerM